MMCQGMVGLSQLAEGLNRKKTEIPEEVGILPATDSGLTLRQQLFPGSPTCPEILDLLPP